VHFDKTPLLDTLAGVTELDVRRVSEYYGVNSVLYGSIRKDVNILHADIKVYMRSSDTSEQFFSSDVAGRYDRLLNILCANILDWYSGLDVMNLLRGELLNLRSEVSFLKEELNKKRRFESAELASEKEFYLRVPLIAGYWSHVDGSWSELVNGTVELTVGIEMYPELQFRSILGMENELFFGLNFSYRNGVSGSLYRLTLNSLVLNPLIGYSVNFSPKNWFYVSCGVFYEFSSWNIDASEYEGGLKQSLTGYSVTLDYSYHFDRRFAVKYGVTLYGYFTSGTSPVVSPYLGAVMTFLRK
jgi:hypothetical protein